MPIVSSGFVNKADLEAEVLQAKKKLDRSEVIDVRFVLGTDSGGEPAIFFGILLSPFASLESRLADVTGRVSTALFDDIQPYNRWGLQSYFSFTSDPSRYQTADWI